MLKGEELPPGAEEGSLFDSLAGLRKQPIPVEYNPGLPIETFEFAFVDECHRSIYTVWRQVLEYFDAFLIGLTATRSKQTFGFFQQNLVMEYGHAEAVADRVNVDYDVYKLRTRISEAGSTVEAGPGVMIGRRDRATRRERWERLDEDLAYDAEALDRRVVAPDQTLKTKPLVRTDLDEFVACFKPGDRPSRTETWSEATPTGRWRAYDYEGLVARDKCSLDLFWLRDETLEASENLPEPDVLASEIADDLRAALAQFEEVAADLAD
jgi:hypothetical protein